MHPNGAGLHLIEVGAYSVNWKSVILGHQFSALISVQNKYQIFHAFELQIVFLMLLSIRRIKTKRIVSFLTFYWRFPCIQECNKSILTWCLSLECRPLRLTTKVRTNKELNKGMYKVNLPAAVLTSNSIVVSAAIFGIFGNKLSLVAGGSEVQGRLKNARGKRKSLYKGEKELSDDGLSRDTNAKEACSPWCMNAAFSGGNHICIGRGNLF